MWLQNFFLFSNFILSTWFLLIFFLILRYTKNFYGEREKPLSWTFIMMGMIFLGFATFTNTAVSYTNPLFVTREYTTTFLYGLMAYLAFEYAALATLLYGFLRMNQEVGT